MNKKIKKRTFNSSTELGDFLPKSLATLSAVSNLKSDSAKESIIVVRLANHASLLQRVEVILRLGKLFGNSLVTLIFGPVLDKLEDSNEVRLRSFLDGSSLEDLDHELLGGIKKLSVLVELFLDGGTREARLEDELSFVLVHLGDLRDFVSKFLNDDAERIIVLLGNVIKEIANELVGNEDLTKANDDDGLGLRVELSVAILAEEVLRRSDIDELSKVRLNNINALLLKPVVQKRTRVVLREDTKVEKSLKDLSNLEEVGGGLHGDGATSSNVGLHRVGNDGV